MEALWVFTSAASPEFMKNFLRLVHFAWRYKFRFGLSVACAAMVALLSFTEIGAVYPLLHILFGAKDPQHWISEKIAGLETEILTFSNREIETAHVLEQLKSVKPRHEELKARYDGLLNECEKREATLRQLEHWFVAAGANELTDAEIESFKIAGRDSRIAQARKKELEESLGFFNKGDKKSLAIRLRELQQEKVDRENLLKRCKWAQPYVNKYLPHESFKTLVLLIGLVMFGVAFKGLFMFMQEVLVADVMQLTLFDIRNKFFRRSISLDLASFSDQGSSELMARFTSDMESFGQGLNTLMSKVMREPMRIVAFLIGALWINWRLTCLTMILIPISGATTIRVGKIMKRAVRRSLESMSTIYKILQESFQGIKIVKAFAMERVERRRFFDETKNLYRKSVRVAMIDALSDPVLEMLTLITVAIALLAGSYLVLNQTIYLNLGIFKLQLAAQEMSIQDLLTLYAVLAAASDPIRKLANVHSKIQRASAAADRICSLMDRTPRVSENRRGPRLKRHRELIEFDRVNFGYSEGIPVLRDLSLTVRKGECIALVGPNGCGKTTLMNLLPRFWDVSGGAIRVDGRDIRDVQIRSLRQQIGIVLQETILFQGTIASNIAYGDPHASRAAIIEAAQRAYAHQFIMATSDGYDTVIGERGHGLSGGQRQRIALARAMLRDPAILILDEATSAVDIQDELLIRKAIEEFAKDRTTFLISHNLASIQVADRIALVNEGRIEAIGTDQELKRASGLYLRLHEIHYHGEAAQHPARPHTFPPSAAYTRSSVS
jgi:subfamily B ATP-binding cassette protein MsbA